MSETTMIELSALLPPETLERLQAEAERQHLPVPALIREAIEAYLDELEEDYEDTPDEKILADLRAAFGDVVIERTQPAREVLEEIRQELDKDDDAG